MASVGLNNVNMCKLQEPNSVSEKIHIKHQVENYPKMRFVGTKLPKIINHLRNSYNCNYQKGCSCK